MFSLEHDRIGKDYTLSLKSYNPSPADFTGSYIAAYLQSLTPHFAVGVETLYQRPTPEMEDCSVGYIAKWHDVKKDEQGQALKDSWIATAQLMSQGIWQATYWKKLAANIDAGVDLICVPALNPRERKAVATAGVKYDFRLATFRGQVDSTGKVSALLEQRLSPAFAFNVAGEIDHVKVRPSSASLSLALSVALELTPLPRAANVQVWCRSVARVGERGGDGGGHERRTAGPAASVNPRSPSSSLPELVTRTVLYIPRTPQRYRPRRPPSLVSMQSTLRVT